MPDPLLELSGVHAGYGSLTILHDLELAVPAGSVVGIVGPNGAGKTTLLRTISRMTRLFDGRIRFDGEDVSERSDVDVARRGVAHVVEGRRVFRGMTVRDNLLVGSYATPAGATDRFEQALVLFPRLRERLGQRAETLSGGEQQMLAIARALMMDPKLMMLDEPSQGLSPGMVKTVIEGVIDVARRGITVLIVEQNVQPVLHALDFAVSMDGGIATHISQGELQDWDFKRLVRTDAKQAIKDYRE